MRDISLSVAWLRDMARYSGIYTMGKRKRNEAQQYKETTLQTLSDEMAVRIVRCGLQDNTSPTTVANNINEFIGQASRNKNLLREVLGRLTKDQIMSCCKALSSTNNAKQRVMVLSKLLFGFTEPGDRQLLQPTGLVHREPSSRAPEGPPIDDWCSLL